MSTEIVNLAKGERVDLSKAAPGATNFAIELYWDPKKFDNEKDFDLDATGFMLDATGTCSGAKDMIGYMMPGFDEKTGGTHSSGCATHSGDEKKGVADKADETITIFTTKVPANIEAIQFNMTIYEAKLRKQTFGRVENAKVVIKDADTGKPIAQYDLSEDFSSCTAVVAAKIYKKDGTWRFQAVGGGYNDGLAGLCRGVGINVKAEE